MDVRSSRGRRTRSGAAVLGLTLALAWTAHAEPPATLEFSREPDALVLELVDRPGELAAEGPAVRVYGNGRVVCHYPAAMKKRGDYELVLPPAELSALVESLADLADFEPADARRRLRAKRAARAGERVRRTDATTTTIALRLARYARPGGPERRNVAKRIVWRGLASDARRHPDVAPVARLARARARLRALMDRPGMRKVR